MNPASVVGLRPARFAAFALAALLGACGPPTAVTTTTTTTIAAPNAGAPATPTTPPPIEDAESPCRRGPQPFVESGGAGVIERFDSDADTIAGIRWTRYEDCDRIVLEFTAPSGAPAVTPPGVGPLFVRSAGVLRLQLDPAVSGSSILDQAIDGGLVEHAFVVRRPSGELFVDLHLGAPASVRVSVASGPARIIVDAVAGGSVYPAPAIVTEDLVVVDPVGGALIYPFTVNGYVRGPADPITVSLSTGDDPVVVDGEVGEQVDAWGAFTVLVADGPEGLATMVIGDRIPVSVDLS